MQIYQKFLLFIIYSVIGWICETIYCSILQKKFVNRGFLHGPLCPVYGFGGLLIVTLLLPLKENIAVLFAASILLTSVLEYATSWILETLFSTKWWDYSHMRFNIRGRVCLLNSLLFGVMALIAVYFVHPFLTRILDTAPELELKLTSAIILIFLAADLFSTLRELVDIREKLSRISDFIQDLKTHDDTAGWFNGHSLSAGLENMRSAAKNNALAEKMRDRWNELTTWTHENSRLLKAFPNLKTEKYSLTLATAKQKYGDMIEKLKQKNDNLKIKNKSVFSNRGSAKIPECVIIKPREKPTDHAKNAADGTDAVSYADQRSFAKGFGFYKIFWIFLFCSLLGTILETMWCFFTTGRLENRSAVIYGPFNMIYGFGALLMSAVLWRWRKKRDLWIFLVCMVIGALFEYLCSWIQELVFGTVSWDYSDMRYNLGGRTNLMFAFIWGILGLVWIKNIMPAFSAAVEKIPIKLGKIFTWIFLVLITVDMSISACAVKRWSERYENLPANNGFKEFLDKRYPDEYLSKVYPNMIKIDVNK